jgi:spore maturation protein CgeB
MRIFLVGAHPGPDTMERHVLAALHEMGHVVQAFNARDIIPGSRIGARLLNALGSRVLREPERVHERRLCNEVSAFQPDLVLALLGSMLSPKTLEKLRRVTSARLVCWCQDQMTTLGRQYLLAGGYDHVFLKDRYLVDLFRRMLGMPANYLPEACNPSVHRIVALTEDERDRLGCDVCTYGNLYYYRQGLVESLDAFDVKIWGSVPDWLINRVPHMVTGKGIYELDKAKALAAARLTVNTLHFGEIHGLNARAFEAAGCGAVQLISESPAAAEHFDLGKELETFASRTELVEKVTVLLADPQRCAAMREAAMKRAHDDHTYVHRLTALLGVVRDEPARSLE